MIQLEDQKNGDRDDAPDRDNAQICLEILFRNALETHIETEPQCSKIRKNNYQNIGNDNDHGVGDPLKIN